MTGLFPHWITRSVAYQRKLPGQMRKPKITQSPVTVTLLDSELDELIECVANAADRAESGSYDMAGTSKAKAIAMQRAKRLYALASRLETARDRRG
jgi:hypothetical protein